MPPDAGSPQLPLGRAHFLASSILHESRRAGLDVDGITPVGALRRFAPAVDHVCLLLAVPRSQRDRTLKAFGRLPSVAQITRQDSSSISVRTMRGTITLRTAEPEDAGAALVWHTGPHAHLEALQTRAERLGFTFEDASLVRREDGTPLPCRTEAEFYAHLGLPFIPPEIRNGNEEIEAAERGTLPVLLRDDDIRGDLHAHSVWSDGNGTIDDMVGAARQLGYAYIAITDHSQRSLSARRLSTADVPLQREEIAAVRARRPGIEVLHGVEVEILPDGSLDFTDDVLEGFDIVLASLHERAGDDGERLTRRYLRAIEHPLVNVITHPANRSPALSPGYPVDFGRLFGAATATGTAMEIDGAPAHLDMDGALARQAVAAGVTIVVDSDCHRVDALARQMRFGVGTARRGWIEPRHVLNTRPLPEVRAFISRKRARR